jgi:hypothetical protein
MSDYKPIPVETARDISKQFDKPVVIILAWDQAHNCCHTVTYGRNPKEKEWAARGGEMATAALGFSVPNKQNFEDFRTDYSEGKYAELKEAAKAALECFEKEFKTLTDGQYGKAEDFSTIKKLKELL